MAASASNCPRVSCLFVFPARRKFNLQSSNREIVHYKVCEKVENNKTNTIAEIALTGMFPGKKRTKQGETNHSVQGHNNKLA